MSDLDTAFRHMADFVDMTLKKGQSLGDITFNTIKKHLLEEMGEKASKILDENKTMLKGEAARLVHQRLEQASDPSTKEDESPVKKTPVVEKKKRRPAASSSEDESDDFVEPSTKKKFKATKEVEKSDSDSDDDFEKHKKDKKVKHDNISKENKRPKNSEHKTKHEAKAEAQAKDKKSKSGDHHKSYDKKNVPAEKKKCDLSEEAQRLKDLAKKIGLNIPPAVFKGSPSSDEIEERLGKFLTSSGLKSLDPSKAEISKLKAERALKAELDGIDTSNIVQGRRTAREEEATRKTFRLKPVDSSDED